MTLQTTSTTPSVAATAMSGIHTVADVLPGFTLAIDDLFAALDETGGPESAST